MRARSLLSSFRLSSTENGMALLSGDTDERAFGEAVSQCLSYLAPNVAAARSGAGRLTKLSRNSQFEWFWLRPFRRTTPDQVTTPCDLNATVMMELGLSSFNFQYCRDAANHPSTIG